MGNITPDKCYITCPEIRNPFTYKLFATTFGEQHDFILHVFVQRKYKAWIGYMTAQGSYAVHNFTF